MKNNQNKITGIFDYTNNQIIIKHANLKNGFLDGKLVEVKKVECMTPDEIAKRNTELGHLPRANLK